MPFRAAFSRASATAGGTISGSAVQVQHSLPARQGGKFQGLAVENLRLGAVYLVERRDRQLELQAAEGVHQVVPAPDGAVFVPQDHIAGAGVGVQHHAHSPRGGGLDEGRQLRLPGQLLRVGHHAAQALARGVDPDVDVPHQPVDSS